MTMSRRISGQSCTSASSDAMVNVGPPAIPGGGEMVTPAIETARFGKIESFVAPVIVRSRPVRALTSWINRSRTIEVGGKASNVTPPASTNRTTPTMASPIRRPQPDASGSSSWLS
jgi:hypothetical protein